VPLIAGAVGGSVVFLALIAVIFFVCRSRNRKPAAPVVTVQVDNYAAINLGANPNVDYNSGDISLNRGNYGHAQSVEYDAGAINCLEATTTRAEERRLLDLAPKRADDPSGKPSIRVQQPSVGADYADGHAIASQ
jgi:hypothetical protein